MNRPPPDIEPVDLVEHEPDQWGGLTHERNVA